MDPLHAVFDGFKLEELDRTWINQVHDSGFTNIEDVPEDYQIFLESPDVFKLLKDTCSVVKDWISKNRHVQVNEHEEISWETLIRINVDVQALLTVLAYFIQKGQSFDASQESRQSCLRATGLYFILLAIPGSNAFQAFHPRLYEIALNSLELSQKLVPREKNSRQNCNNSELGEDDGSDFSISLSKSQIITLTEELNAVMYDLVVMLKSACTSMEVRSLEITIYYLVEMIKLADEPINFERINQATTSSLAYNAYVALEQICNPKYAPIQAIASIIGKYMLPLFLVSGTNLPPKQLAIIRESTLYFFKNLLTTHGKEIQSSLLILIQHTIIKCPDRLEGRQKQAVIIVKLLNVLCTDEATLRKCLKDIIRFSHHGKIPCRIFAQEIISKLLMDLLTGKNRNEDNSDIHSSYMIKKFLLAIVLSRCVDTSSMVRGRAMATLAEFTDSIRRIEVRSLFETPRDVERVGIPNLEKLEEAIDSENEETILPDTEELLIMLKERLEDERALIRKSALQVLYNGILISPLLLDDHISIVCQRCRDSILTVRRYAIRILTNLLETFADREELCEDWVDSVVPRVFDSETKVQEEVVESLQKLVLDKITNYCPSNDSNSLPWRILNEIAIKKMGDHLSKACAIWAEGNKITETKISHIKSHIGTSNNMGSWLLLASISESKKLTDIESYYTYYGRPLIESGDSDSYLTSLAVRVLKNTWSTFDHLILLQLSQDLTDCIKNYRIKVALIRSCMEILIDVLKYLNGNENESSSLMREFLDISESTVRNIVESEGEENFDNFLFRAICTLGHASFLSWQQVTKDTRRIIQRFLLEWHSLPHWIQERKELQGAAVMVLGQQSLLDRDIAAEMTPIFGCLLCNKNKNSPRVLRERNSRHSSLAIDDPMNFSIRSRDLNRFGGMASGSAVRVNAAKALADICVRFTALVEPYLPDMCISMKDPDPEVRQVILVIFIQLLVEETIMVKEAFFFHILTMLTDEDSTIREMTVFLIKERLLAKNKNLITQQFLKGIYHFNDYQRLTSTRVKRRRSLSNRGIALSLNGTENTKKRQIIYDFMLENIDPPGKLTIFVKITKHILHPRSNDNLDVKCENGISMIRDALYILSSDHFQMHAFSKQTVEEDNLDETSTSGPSSHVVEAIKKHRYQVFLPCLVELKRHCEEMRSPAMKDVSDILTQIIADSNKEALSNLYNEYPDLEREMQRDNRSLSKLNREDSVRENEESGYCETPKKSNFERHSHLLSPDRIPRIVLRRLSSLTYPDVSGHSSVDT